MISIVSLKVFVAKNFISQVCHYSCVTKVLQWQKAKFCHKIVFFSDKSHGVTNVFTLVTKDIVTI